MIVTICEMIMTDDRGATINIVDNNKMIGELFGEDQSRYIITISPELESIFEKKMKKRGVKYELIGCITSSQLKINDNISCSLANVISSLLLTNSKKFGLCLSTQN